MSGALRIFSGRSRDDEIARGEILERRLGGVPHLEYCLYAPRALRPDAPLLVSVPGISGNARRHVEVFAPLAERHGAVVVAPHFARPAFRDYQRLGRVDRGERADVALHRLTAEVGRLTGADCERIRLFGHSGGAQFAHRYAMAYPERVARVVVAAAGWYTFPDPARAFPYGVRRSRRLPGVRFDLKRLLKVPTLVVVGTLDVQRSSALRHSPRLDAQQGNTRLERAARFVEAMAAASREHGLRPAQALRTLSDTYHAFASGVGRGGLAEMASAYLLHPRREITQKADPGASPANAIRGRL